MDAIAGRFDINPPLYYEMRLKHSGEKLAKEPFNWDLYDNVAVAQEKLGFPEKSITVMEQKWALLEPKWKQRRSPALDDAAYRTHANWGTFLVHLHFKQAASSTKDPKYKPDAKLIESSLDHLREAVKINPNAHFGRENVQIALIELIQSLQTDPYDPWFAFREFVKSNGWKKTETGILGMMNFGSGWDSPDMVYLLGCNQGAQGNTYLSEVAQLKVDEMLREGKVSLFKSLTKEELRVDRRGSPWSPTGLKEDFAILVANGKRYRETRTEFMMSRLNSGRHPDWDKQFWEGYTREPRPSLPDRRVQHFFITPYSEVGAVRMVAVGIASLLAGFLCVKYVRKARQSRSSS